MGDRRTVYIVKYKEKVCVLVINGLFICGQSMAKVAVYWSLFTGSDNSYVGYMCGFKGGQ